MYGFYRMAAAVPVLRVGDVAFNCDRIIELYREAAERQAAAAVFPELSVTAYSCGDLFFQESLIAEARAGMRRLAEASGPTLLVFGVPLLVGDALYNMAAVAQNGRLRALVPKAVLPNYREFYEKRQFAPAGRLTADVCEGVPCGAGLVLDDRSGVFRCGIEICEDLWSVVPPSSWLALGGARVICNLSAGTELTAKADYRRELVRQQSARLLAGYVLANAGVHESTSDQVFGGHALIADNGRLAAENRRFNRDGSIIYADIDLERLGQLRRSESSFLDNPVPPEHRPRGVAIDPVPGAPDLAFAWIPPLPFVPGGDRRERCREIFDIQCAGLAKRVEHTRARTMVIGVSGGLDSTLALLVAAECCRLLGRDPGMILAVTMPGFGTTAGTRNHAGELCRLLGTSFAEIPIGEACTRHFADIGHDPAALDVTYENVQARQRTQILMNLANKHQGLVIGTGDLSEIALGWNTYNGDHMSMYAVNASVPKTLIRFLIAEAAADAGPELARLLQEISDTPVSPELLPPDATGAIRQKTEEILGSYELHDFFLYHFLKYGAPRAKLAGLARHAFAGRFTTEAIERTLEIFITRFYRQQFKRNCMPDGPKVGTIALSPRADWRMPADAAAPPR